MDNAKQPNHCIILFTENIPEMRGLSTNVIFHGLLNNPAFFFIKVVFIINSSCNSCRAVL